MKDKNREQMDAVFQVRKQKAADLERQATELAENTRDSKEKFVAVRDNVIRPKFDQFVPYLAEHGHTGLVTVNERGSITIDIHPAGYVYDGFNDKHPSLTFAGGSSGVSTHISTVMPASGGVSGGGKNFKLEDVTSDLVEAELTELITECFNR